MSGRRPDPSAVGLTLAVAGMLLLTLTPVAGRWADVPPSLALTALGAAVLLMLIGAAVGLLGGREHADSEARADDAGDPPGPPPG